MDNNNLFDKIEDQFDQNPSQPASGSADFSAHSDPAFKEGLAYRTKIQEAWNKAADYERTRNQVNAIRQRHRNAMYKKAVLFLSRSSLHPGFDFLSRIQVYYRTTRQRADDRRNSDQIQCYFL